jgi:AraC-like DNA-binding protein
MLQTERSLYFRASPKPNLRLPISVRSAGHYHIGEGWGGERPSVKMFYQLFWTTGGSGVFRLGGHRWECKAGDVFLYRPGETHSLTSCGAGWRYRWLTLDGASTTATLEAFGPQRRRWYAGPCPEGVFESLHAAIRNVTPSGEIEASSLAVRILGAAYTGTSKDRLGHPIAVQCKQILDSRFQDSQLTLDAVAVELRVHRTTLFRHFRQSFRMAPSDYLRNLRLQQAIMALGCGSDPIGEISRHFGFEDPNYFARLVRRTTGRSPRQLRSGD